MVGPQPEGKTEGTQTFPVPKYLPYGPVISNDRHWFAEASDERHKCGWCAAGGGVLDKDRDPGLSSLLLSLAANYH